MGSGIVFDFSARQVLLQLLELIRDRSHSFVELRAAEILKNPGFLVILSA